MEQSTSKALYFVVNHEDSWFLQSYEELISSLIDAFVTIYQSSDKHMFVFTGAKTTFLSRIMRCLFQVLRCFKSGSLPTDGLFSVSCVLVSAQHRVVHTSWYSVCSVLSG